VPRTPTDRLKTTADELRELVEFMREHELAELTIEEGKDYRKLTLRRGELPAAPAPPPLLTAAPADRRRSLAPTQPDDEFDVIESPIIGTFHRASAPGEEPFVSPGDTIEPGAVLCIIEAMKLMNQIEAEFRAQVIEVLVENATPVEYGQPLFRVRRL
jgi:acetyl-CoA carboxylase biotin carboxyl carrier protein